MSSVSVSSAPIQSSKFDVEKRVSITPGKKAELLYFLRIFILLLIGIVAVCSRLFSVIRFESIIHEFDPWFNYRATRYLVDNGWFSFLNWFDDTAWYPLGRVLGHTVFPGIMVTSALIHYLMNSILAIAIDIREVCVFLAPVFSAATAYVVYGLTLEIAPESPTSALLASMFMGVIPGYISRSVAGSYDNEAIAIFLLGATFLMWLRAVRRGSAAYGILAALSYFAMVASWGGYIFITNLIPLHALTLMAMGYYSSNLYIAYCTYYVLGTVLSMLIPFVGTYPLRASDHLGAIGVFGLMQLVSICTIISELFPENSPAREKVKKRLSLGIVGVALFVLFSIVFLSATGVISSWGGRFMSLWDTSYAKRHSPLIASVSEHQPTPWATFFLDLNLLMFAFPASIWLSLSPSSFKSLGKRIGYISVEGAAFLILYAVTGAYFAGVMIRLILTLAPIICIGGGIVFGGIQERMSTRLRRGTSYSLLLDGAVACVVMLSLFQFARHCTWATSTAYSSPSVVLSSTDHTGRMHIVDDFREAYYWIRKNTPARSKVFSWWDYGYQLAGFSERVTIVDNNTWNFTHIGLVGRAFALPEPSSYEILRELDVDYVLVIAGVASGFSGDDINKFLWMIKIAENELGPASMVSEEAFYGAGGQYRVDAAGASETIKSSLLYKLVYHGFDGQKDFARGGAILPNPISPLNSLEEVYSSERFIVRIFKVRPPDALGRSHVTARAFDRR
ncbi:oligosaccharyl transferase stt3 subunit [Mitosporidium daphniae]|uniref:dolichyl-diphosphooligosaccharide--protein glycotransferase n=1 Tax=Mitosporidium daphniae TaxID=1485682 RepID=A0A098VSU7_9MICR|nr:putative subunit Stt3 of oligosaccharyl transferase [Mitosporidium daphniae]KGG52168.1 putative subunit Stt3 of oligosaccharyl transferase [Mitosporidium daphniae]|eukprot:XP_013238595.1 putative subunit Stt3 of oligosaccharyl transferase [Mitosporidium daphniae]